MATGEDTERLDGLLDGIESLDGPDAVAFPQAAMVFAAVCASIFAVVGVGGNLLTVVALLRCPKLRLHATTMFVISLAFSDLLFSAVNLPITAARYVAQKWPFDNGTDGPICWLFPFFFYGNVAASLMSMVAITINRYVLISYHAHYHRIYTKPNIALMILLVWGFSFGIMVPPLIGIYGKLGLENKTFSCTIRRDEYDRSPKKFLMVFGFLLPCLVIIGCYTAIFVKVKQSRKNVQSHQNGGGTKQGVAAPEASSSGTMDGRSSTGDVKSSATSQSAHQKREDMRLTRMMLTIFCCFVVSFLPLTLVNVADDAVKVPTLHVIASVLAWGSAIVNPFIYAFKNRQYQQAFARVVCFKAVTSSARTMAGLTGSGNGRKRGSCPKKSGSRNDPESGQQDKDSKNSTTMKNGSSKTFLTDTVGKAGGGGKGCNTDNAEAFAQEEDGGSSSSNRADEVPQSIEMAARSSPQDKVWCHFPAVGRQ